MVLYYVGHLLQLLSVRLLNVAAAHLHAIGVNALEFLLLQSLFNFSQIVLVHGLHRRHFSLFSYYIFMRPLSI